MVYIYEIKRETYPNYILEKKLLEHEKQYSREEFEDIVIEAKCKIEEYIEEYDDDIYDETMESICDEAEDDYLEAIADYLIEYKDFKRYFVKEAMSIFID